MGGSFAVGVREHRCLLVGTAGPHGDKELVDGHGRVDGDLPALEGRQGDLADAVGGRRTVAWPGL